MQKKEYGGYIEFEYFHGKELHSGALALNSGRHCVEYLIRAKNIRKLYMPYYMCDSVCGVCERLGVDVSFYHTDISFLPLFDGELSDGEWLYVVNFYGQLSIDAQRALKAKYDRLIIDNAQAFFCLPIPNTDTIYTCRKFFGVSDGGYLYTDKLLDGELQHDLSYDRMEFLFGRMEKGANEFYPQYAENNKRFASQPLKAMSKATQNIMRAVDYERIKRVRTENFMCLHEKLKEKNKLDLTIPQGAFMYPLYIENGAEIRKRLQAEKIYVPTLWPDIFSRCGEGELEYDMAKNILPLPVDQRYSIFDIHEIIRVITDIL